MPPEMTRKPSASKRVGQHFCIGHDLLGIFAEAGLHGFQEADCFGRDDVHEWTALHAGKHRLVDGSGKLLPGEDHAGARTAQCFVGGGGHDMGIRHGRGMRTSGYEPSKVSHIDQEERADFVGDLPHAGESMMRG